MRFATRVLPYGVAIGSTAIAVLFSLWLESLIYRTIGAFFYLAIIVSSWYGGFRPGFVTVVLSTLAIDYFLLMPKYQLWKNQPEDVLRLGLFFVVALMMNLLTANFRHSKQKIQQLSQQLTQTNAEKLQMALSASQIGMWDWNLVTGEITWTPEHEQLFGLPLGTFDGKHETFDARVHPEDRSELNQILQQVLARHSSYQHEFRVIWPDGSIHWVEGRGHGFYNPVGEPVRMTGTVISIDERKQAQSLLQQQFEQQRLVMEITQRIRRTLDLQDILQTTVDEVRQFLQCDRVIIFQFAPDWSGTVVIESVDAQWTAILSTNIYDPCFGEEYVTPFKQGLVTAKSDIYTADIDYCHLELLAKFQVKANLVVPILDREELWGLLIAHQCASPREWQTAEIELLRQLATQVSIAIQQAALFAQIQTELQQRQQAQAALQAREATLRLFIEYAPAGIAMFDTEMKYIMASQRWVNDYHLDSIASLIERSHYEIFPDIPEHWRQIHQRCLAGATEKCDEELFIRADGTQQWIHWEIHPWYSAGDIIGGIIIFSEDITPQKQAKIALEQLNAELEQRIQERTATLTEVNNCLEVALIQQQQARQLLEEQAQLLDLAHDTIMTRDLTGKITFWNQGAEFMYGWKKAEALGQISHILLKTKFPQPLVEIETQLLEHGYWQGELIHVKRDNQPITVASRWVVQKDQSGKPIKVLEINNDITAQKQAQTALRESEENFRQLAENIQAVFWMSDIKNEQVIYVSPAYEMIWQQSCQSLYQKASNWLDAVHPDDRPGVEIAEQEMLTTGKYDIEYKIIRPNGSIRWIRDRAFPIKNEADEIIRLAGIAEDITERHKIEQIKNEFIGIVSHELRTPLTAIRAALGLLKSGIYEKKPERLKRMIEIASIDTDRLVRLVNDILDLERLESGRAVLQKTTCNAADLIQQAVAGVQAIANQQHITLNIHPTDAQVWAAPDTIIQTITNLLSNAIKFSPADSTITLSVQQQPDCVQFQISDEGRGIPADKLEAIFGRFQQVDASDSRGKGGTGLGLAICRSIIEQHSGKIWAESTVGIGSRFFFTLPLPPEELT